MSRAPAGTRAPPEPLSRRAFLGLGSAAAVALWMPRAWAAPARSLDGRDPASLSAFEREHLPVVRIPEVAANGAKVPIVVEMEHPMTPDHFVRTLRVANLRDPVPSKGVFDFTPSNGRVYLSFQARVHEGASRVSVTAECSRHGEWTTSRAVLVPADAGG